MADVDVQVKTLLPQATVWEDQSKAMSKIASEIRASSDSNAAATITAAGGHSFSGVGISGSYPLFNAAIGPYKQATAMYETLCSQGAEMMSNIHDTLVKAHKAYVATESANTQNSANAH